MKPTQGQKTQADPHLAEKGQTIDQGEGATIHRPILSAMHESMTNTVAPSSSVEAGAMGLNAGRHEFEGGDRAPTDAGLQHIKPLLVSAQFFQIGTCSIYPLPPPDRQRHFVAISGERRSAVFIRHIGGGTFA